MDVYIMIAGVGSLLVVFYNYLRKKYRSESEESESGIFRRNSGFDYINVKQKIEMQKLDSEKNQELLHSYQEVNALQDDLIIASKADELIPIQLTWKSNSGTSHTLKVEADPDTLMEFCEDISDDYATSLSEL